MIKKKKIAIITLPLRNYNYGGILQNYALQKYLIETFNVEVYTIMVDYKQQKNKIKQKLFKLLYYDITKIKKSINSNLENFILSNIHTTETFYEIEDVSLFLKQNSFEVIITGSDQVFRSQYLNNQLERIMFLDYDKKDNGTKKIAYAASFGKDSWEKQDRKKIIENYLKNFDAISVREDSGISICNNDFGVEAVQLIDPTLLLNINDYVALFKHQTKSIKTNRIMFSYVLDQSEDKKRLIQTVSDQLGAESSQIELLNDQLSKISKYNYKEFQRKKAASSEDWLFHFYEADYIITDSFHGVVFSILFNKPFVALGNEFRGMTRFQSLLKLFNLEEHLVLDGNEDKILKLLRKTIDYEKVNAILLQERNKSFNYLEKAILYET